MSRRTLLCVAALVLCRLAAAQTVETEAPDTGTPWSGQIRLQWDERQANTQGPLAQAHARDHTTLALPASGATLETLLRSSGRGWNASATLEQQTTVGQATHSRAFFNELVATHDAGPWQFSAGKKIVAWDVGYAFRPNDTVQQEERRTLVSSLSEGRPLLMAEHFDADTAWSLVWVNPSHARSVLAAQEPALAARVYQRQGSVDWHGFARWGAHTGASVGTAVAWVASDALELHASARALQHADSRTFDERVTGLARSDPWTSRVLDHRVQALVGGTWTHESQFSVLAEAWWDGTALNTRQWNAWRARNAMLVGLSNHGAPLSAVAGNLAWQGDALAVSSSLRRANLYTRLGWEHEGWQPTLDLLYQPADAGRMLTAAVLHKANRLQLQAGWRATGGPASAVLAQLATRREVFVQSTWPF